MQTISSVVLTHRNTKMVNSKGVLCEHPLKKQPSQTTLNTVSTTLSIYLILFMINNLNSLELTHNQ